MELADIPVSIYASICHNYGMAYVKWTSEILAPIVANSTSYAQVIRALNLRIAGGTYSNIKRRIKKFGLDTSHFLGKGANCGNAHKGGSDKKKASQILILRSVSDHPEHAHLLKRALLEVGVPYRCALCDLAGQWNNKPLSLEIDHINGRRWDCRRTNLRFLCPNCHSQTETNGSKNIRTRGGTGRHATLRA